METPSRSRLFSWRRLGAVSGVFLLLALLVWKWFDPAKLITNQQQHNDDLIAEQMAYHVGVMAYLYGYPIVDMLSQMHNETHRVEDDQFVLAPVNRIFRYPGLITPANSGNLRAPNADTLYFSAWYDIREEPVILSTPDTDGRYFTIAVTNMYAEVSHIGRRTTGTKPRLFALVPPGWNGTLPDGVETFPVETTRGWLLGRMYVSGSDDLTMAASLVDHIILTPLRLWTGTPMPLPDSVEKSQRAEPQQSLAFFEVLDSALRELPPRESETALLDQFRQIGLGGETPFSIDTLSESRRRGLERAVEDGANIVDAASQRTIPDFNGWMISDKIGRYGFEYMHRASVARGGYGNLPEESLYPAAVFDTQGHLLSGGNRYRIRFPAGSLPPVRGFWSITVYDLLSLGLVDSPLERFNIGDRTPGLIFADDGSLTLHLQREPPAEGLSNWMPLPNGFFTLVMRLYEPEPPALNREWIPPSIEVVESD